MTPVLANLLKDNGELFRDISRHLDSGHYFPPAAMAVMLAVVVQAILMLWWLKRRRQLQLRPDAATLLRQAAERLGLDKAQWRLLARLGRESGFEPVAALVSPAMLDALVSRWSERFGPPPPAHQARLDAIRRLLN